MFRLNAANRIRALKNAKEYDDLEDVSKRFEESATEPFTYRRKFANVLELAPILSELAAAFRSFGLRYKGGTHFVDGAWNADVNLKGKELIVQFSPA